MIKRLYALKRIFTRTILLLFLFIICHESAKSQSNRYWDQNLNSKLHFIGSVIAGEGGIAAIYYNPATISEMKETTCLFRPTCFLVYPEGKNALGRITRPKGLN